jgi:tetratricopeptide (TPR) repeat protein
MVMRLTRSWRRTLMALAGIALGPGRAAAQDDPRLLDAVRLAQEGRSDSARAVVGVILAATAPSDSLYPQVLYTQGILARSTEERRRFLSRIAVEYALSPWADDALLQLAMLDYGAGNPAGAARYVERIRSDYPDSPLVPLAAYWAARSYFDIRRPADACRWLADGLARVGDDLETRNQLSWLQGRCTAPPARDSTRPDTVKTPPAQAAQPPGATPPARTGFAVQAGAVNTQAAADKLVADLKTAGFAAYVVRQANLFKVRVGPYPDRAQAQTALPAVRRAVGGSPFVVKEP